MQAIITTKLQRWEDSVPPLARRSLDYKKTLYAYKISGRILFILSLYHIYYITCHYNDLFSYNNCTHIYCIFFEIINYFIIVDRVSGGGYRPKHSY